MNTINTIKNEGYGHKICNHMEEKSYSYSLNIDEIIQCLANRDSNLMILTQDKAFKLLIEAMKHHYDYLGLKLNDIE